MPRDGDDQRLTEWLRVLAADWHIEIWRQMLMHVPPINLDKMEHAIVGGALGVKS